MCYFDYNSTTPLCPSALQALKVAYQEHWQNASTLYRAGALVHILLEEARERIAKTIGGNCKTEEIIFNSGATESTNAIFTYLKNKFPASGKILISKAEHAAIAESAKYYFPNQFEEIPLDSSGVLNIDELQQVIESISFLSPSCERALALFACAAHNETGVIQPWKQIAQLCRQKGILYLCDASQWIGKLPLKDLDQPDFVFGSGHKFGAAKGIGFLKISPNCKSFSSLKGGEQEHGHRAGTENYPGIATLAAALQETQSLTLDPMCIESKNAMRTDFEKKVLKAIPGTKILGEKAERLWNTVALLMPIGESGRWVRLMDTLGFQLSTGSACKSAKELRSSVWGALHLNEEQSQRVLRISSGWETQSNDWQKLAEALSITYQKILSTTHLDSSDYSSIIQLD